MKGRRIALSPARKLVCELMHFALRTPTIPHSYQANIAAVVAARNALQRPPSWMAIMLQAYGRLCQQTPVFRQAYIPGLRPHLYEHPHSVGVALITRRWGEEDALLGAKLRDPGGQTLMALSQHLERFQKGPIEEISDFRQLMRLARMPKVLRRFFFWLTLNWNGAKRAKRFGTFMISSLGSLGVQQEHPISPFTTYFVFGPIADNGDVTFRIIYDHRVMDGRTCAKAFEQLETILNGVVRDELLEMKTVNVSDTAGKEAA